MEHHPKDGESVSNYVNFALTQNKNHCCIEKGKTKGTNLRKGTEFAYMQIGAVGILILYEVEMNVFNNTWFQ